MIDDYGTQITADSNVQLDSDTTLYARYGTGFTSYTSYWKAPGVLHIDIDKLPDCQSSVPAHQRPEYPLFCRYRPDEAAGLLHG